MIFLGLPKYTGLFFYLSMVFLPFYHINLTPNFIFFLLFYAAVEREETCVTSGNSGSLPQVCFACDLAVPSTQHWLYLAAQWFIVGKLTNFLNYIHTCGKIMDCTN